MSYKIAIDSCGELLDEWKNDGRIESIPLDVYKRQLWGFRDREELENNGADIVAAVPGDLFTIYEEKQHD